MPAVACLNGVWQAPESAKVSVLDRGFLFGDGIYEVIPAYRGKPFTLERHLRRLSRSLSEVGIPDPLTADDWQALVTEAVTRSGEDPAYVYVQVTRGMTPIRHHEYPDSPQPTVLVMAYEAPNLRRDNIRPYRMITCEDFRWQRADIKTTSLMAAGLLKNEALRRGADDVILLREGNLTEASASNVILALGDKLVTPVRDNLILHGITRDLVLELAVRGGIPVEERVVREFELRSADEIIITSAGHEVWPVIEVDGEAVGNGEPGVMWQRLDALFQDYKKEAFAASSGSS